MKAKFCIDGIGNIETSMIGEKYQQLKLSVTQDEVINTIAVGEAVNQLSDCLPGDVVEVDITVKPADGNTNYLLVTNIQRC